MVGPYEAWGPAVSPFLKQENGTLCAGLTQTESELPQIHLFLKAKEFVISIICQSKRVCHFYPTLKNLTHPLNTRIFTQYRANRTYLYSIHLKWEIWLIDAQNQKTKRQSLEWWQHQYPIINPIQFKERSAAQLIG